MRLPHISAVVLLGVLAGCTEHAGSPLSPTPENRLQGTYTLTAGTSPSCEFQGSWTFRADITQSGRDLQVKLWKSNGDSFCGFSTYEICQPSFHGQDNPDGVLFFPDSSDMLFVSRDPDVGFYLLGEVKRGSGHALGQYSNGRIDALYDGEVNILKTRARCYAPNHTLTFVRR